MELEKFEYIVLGNWLNFRCNERGRRKTIFSCCYQGKMRVNLESFVSILGHDGSFYSIIFERFFNW